MNIYIYIYEYICQYNTIVYTYNMQARVHDRLDN